ncbi:hypothetical protein [Loigolactobacillus coryniformis]|uniref:hypothetical protein n=1 Tax=Loigolactobacillus coryniformis TaxID=1610 RepID=UPI00345DF5A3
MSNEQRFDGDGFDWLIGRRIVKVEDAVAPADTYREIGGEVMSNHLSMYRITSIYSGGSVGVYWRSRKVEVRVYDAFEDHDYSIYLTLNVKQLTRIAKDIARAGELAWVDIKPKEAQSDAADWYSYYDKEFTNEGCFNLPIRRMVDVTTATTAELNKHVEFLIERPSAETFRCFQFNKAMMQDYLADYYKRLTELNRIES